MTRLPPASGFTSTQLDEVFGFNLAARFGCLEVRLRGGDTWATGPRRGAPTEPDCGRDIALVEK